VEPVADARRLVDLHPPVLEQLALADLIGSGAFDRHVRQMRQRYRRRRDALLRLVAEHSPWLRMRGVAAGLHLVLEMPPDGPGEQELLARAVERSVVLHGLGHFWHHPRPQPQALVVGYGGLPEQTYQHALEMLADILSCASSRE
jgi:GntR family transcriptional regulator/MocR family aminotransferase